MPVVSGWHRNGGQISNHPIHPIGNAADGLIEIDSLDQLNAVRYDLDDNGQPPNDNAAAFPGRSRSRRCPDTSDIDLGLCLGYELAADLDLGTNGGWQCPHRQHGRQRRYPLLQRRCRRCYHLGRVF